MQIGQKIEIAVTMEGIYQYEVYDPFGRPQERYIYKMVDKDGTVYVWKTYSFFCEKYLDMKNGWDYDSKGNRWNYDKINKGDCIKVKGTVKGFGEYKGEKQTVLQRVKLVERTFKAKSFEEIQAERQADKDRRKQEQLDSLGEGDWIWFKMPYRQYKDHYSDCETVIDSFDVCGEEKVVDVIIRAGRLKPSGVRGKRFKGYEVVNELGEFTCYRAVSEENAIRRANKEFPSHEWTCRKIYS